MHLKEFEKRNHTQKSSWVARDNINRTKRLGKILKTQRRGREGMGVRKGGEREAVAEMTQ